VAEPADSGSRLEVVAFDHDPVRRRLAFDLLDRGTGPPVTWAIQSVNAALVVLARDAVVGDVAVEVRQACHVRSLATRFLTRRSGNDSDHGTRNTDTGASLGEGARV
jgi:hypothetical protein